MKTRIIFSVLLLFLQFTIASQSTRLQYTKIYDSGNGKYIRLMQNGKSIAQVPIITSPTDIKSTKDPVDNNNDNVQFFWSLKFTMPGKVFKDVSFAVQANVQTGYIVTELGAVYKTTNGGDNWVSKLDIGFPYYWYGVHALSADTVVICGFNNQGNIREGVIRWSYNGGTTWTPDIILRFPVNAVGWLDKIHFFNQNTGLAFASWSGGVYYTNTGGKDTLSWSFKTINSDLAWIAGNIDAHPNGNVYATGIHFAKSTNFGVNWVSGPSVDNTFDGGVDFFTGDLYGLTGGGTISPTVAGWVHATSNGGVNWSGRTLNTSYPIRSVIFWPGGSYAFACGGNVYSEAGGIYLSYNSGQSWSLEQNTSAEMFSIKSYVVIPIGYYTWCVGSTGSSTGFNGKAYYSFYSPNSVNQQGNSIPDRFELGQNYPNPFNPSTIIKFRLKETGFVSLKVYDSEGRESETLVIQTLTAGNYEVNFDASELPSGVYFYKLTAGNYSETKRMILLR